MRRIDADVLIRNIEAMAAEYDAISIHGIIEALKEAPTITPEDSRPRGRWIASKKCDHKPCRIKNPDKWMIYECSECGYSNGRRHTAYCPNCGALMDGKESNNA